MGVVRYQWIAEYGCGCTEVQDNKKDLLGYCHTHGNDAKRITKLPIAPGLKKMDKGLAG